MNNPNDIKDKVEIEKERKLELGLDEKSIEDNKQTITEIDADTAVEKAKKLILFLDKHYKDDNDSDLEKLISSIKEGANLDYETEKGNTPLIVCAKKGYTSAFITLLKYGANINVFNKNKTYPIISASRHGYADIVSIALLMGADVNSRDFAGDTSLMLAKKYGMQEVFDILIQAGAYIAQKNDMNLTSYDFKNVVAGKENIHDEDLFVEKPISPLTYATHEDAMELISEARSKYMAINESLPSEVNRLEQEKNKKQNPNFKVR